ncbi:alanyl-tRNA editing protein [Rhodobacteraceae bacterium 2CG4]|uniref:Alanyl-tRNA editing protein n=1 Tax=Halovulum marinum TaxID=2662447 RepID=A0A6L5Z371_9RHOB|nr:alanyl-tRNA editing protein [Halovulum marinum]
MYRDDAYLREAGGRVAALTGRGGVVLDASLFYPTGGGQAGDAGRLEWDGGATAIATTVRDGDAIVLVPAEGAPLPPAGAAVRQVLDWQARHRMMRLHTALHLLSVVIPLPVTGGQITPDKGRLDFDMPEAPEDKQALEAALNALIAADHPVGETWISDAELAASPGLVKTMSVKPPTGAGRVRLVRIGTGAAQIDLQPCGGTHVRTTGEIGPVSLGKIEKKGRQNRRVTVRLA